MPRSLSRAIGLVAFACIASACGGSTAQTEPSSPSPAPLAASSAPPASPSADESIAATAPTESCRDGATHDALAAIAPGRSLFDLDADTNHLHPTRDLRPLFPTLGAAGLRVLAIAPSDPVHGDVPAFAAILVGAREPVSIGTAVEGARLGVIECTTGHGYRLVAEPFPVDVHALADLRTQPLLLPGGGRATSVLVQDVRPDLDESLTNAYLVGRGSGALQVLDPRGGEFGEIAEVGNVAERTVVSEGRHAGSYALDAVGWYPLADALVFARVNREYSPDEPGQAILVRPIALLDARGLNTQSDFLPAAWFVVGPGAMPAFCTERRDLRCAALTENGQPIGGVPYAWIAGAWDSDGRPPRELRAPGMRWFWGGALPQRMPREPNGHAPLTTIQVPRGRERGGV